MNKIGPTHLMLFGIALTAVIGYLTIKEIKKLSPKPVELPAA